MAAALDSTHMNIYTIVKISIYSYIYFSVYLHTLPIQHHGDYFSDHVFHICILLLPTYLQIYSFDQSLCMFL